jgi:hypothetical protein
VKEEQAKHAFFLSLAALLGEKVFNFGELLAHKVPYRIIHVFMLQTGVYSIYKGIWEKI